MNLDRVYTGRFDGSRITDRFAVGHIRKVLRLGRGDVFAGYDGGREWILEITGAGRDAIEVEAREVREIPPRAARRITLAAALLKTKAWETLLEKTAELGVAEIQPLLTGRTVAKVKGGAAEDKLGRWTRIAASAAAQSAGRLPDIKQPQRLDVYFKEVSGLNNKYIMWSGEGARALAGLVRGAGGGDVILLVGPEGDWTEGELDAARAAGFRAAHLGPGILRAETAAIAAAAIAALVE